MRNNLSALSLLAAALWAGLPVYGQGSKGSASTSTSSSSATTSTVAPNGPTNVQVNDPSWFLNGHVMMEDGSVPTERVDIESVCSGVRHTEAHVDKKGEFSFRLGRANPGVINDASQTTTRSAPPSGTFNVDPSVAISMSQNPLGDCAIHAVLVGYRSDVILLAGRTQADNPNIGTIILHPTTSSPGGPVSAASLAAPKAAQKAYEKGTEAEKNRKTAEAAKDLAEAVHLYPQYAQAWFELGNVQAAMNDAATARQSYDMALNADPNFTPPYLKIAQMEEKDKDWKGVADTTGKLIKIAPDSEPEVYLFNSAANYNLKDMAAAEASARAGIKVDTVHRIPKFWYILGVLLANRGDFAGAIDQYKNYLQYAPDGPDAATVKAQLAQVEKLAGAKE
jgi:tetratricopeptide (TPR) repeat protein